MSGVGPLQPAHLHLKLISAFHILSTVYTCRTTVSTSRRCTQCYQKRMRSKFEFFLFLSGNLGCWYTCKEGNYASLASRGLLLKETIHYFQSRSIIIRARFTGKQTGIHKNVDQSRKLKRKYIGVQITSYRRRCIDIPRS